MLSNLKGREPIDYSKLVVGMQVTLLGEVHTKSKHKEIIAQQLDQWYEQGITHIGLEMLPRNLQSDVDTYIMTGDEGAEEKVQIGLKDWGWKNYEQIIEKAREQWALNGSGIRVMALDMDYNIAEKLTEKIVGDHKEFQRYVAARDEVTVKRRNRFMVGAILGLLKTDASMRMVVLAGRAHISGMKKLLRERDVNVASFAIVSAVKSYSEHESAQEEIELKNWIEAMKTISSKDSYYVRSPNPDLYDGILRLPNPTIYRTLDGFKKLAQAGVLESELFDFEVKNPTDDHREEYIKFYAELIMEAQGVRLLFLLNIERKIEQIRRRIQEKTQSRYDNKSTIDSIIRETLKEDEDIDLDQLSDEITRVAFNGKSVDQLSLSEVKLAQMRRKSMESMIETLMMQLIPDDVPVYRNNSEEREGRFNYSFGSNDLETVRSVNNDIHRTTVGDLRQQGVLIKDPFNENGIQLVHAVLVAASPAADQGHIEAGIASDRPRSRNIHIIDVETPKMAENIQPTGSVRSGFRSFRDSIGIKKLTPEENLESLIAEGRSLDEVVRLAYHVLKRSYEKFVGENYTKALRQNEARWYSVLKNALLEKVGNRNNDGVVLFHGMPSISRIVDSGGLEAARSSAKRISRAQFGSGLYMTTYPQYALDYAGVGVNPQGGQQDAAVLMVELPEINHGDIPSISLNDVLDGLGAHLDEESVRLVDDRINQLTDNAPIYRLTDVGGGVGFGDEIVIRDPRIFERAKVTIFAPEDIVPAGAMSIVDSRNKQSDTKRPTLSQLSIDFNSFPAFDSQVASPVVTTSHTGDDALEVTSTSTFVKYRRRVIKGVAQPLSISDVSMSEGGKSSSPVAAITAKTLRALGASALTGMVLQPILQPTIEPEVVFRKQLFSPEAMATNATRERSAANWIRRTQDRQELERAELLESNINGLQSSDVFERFNAVSLLTDFGSVRAFAPLLEAYYREEDEFTRGRILIAIGATNHAQAFETIRREFDNSQDNSLKGDALEAMEHINDPRASAYVAGHLSSSDDLLLHSAVRTLSRRADPQSVQPLFEAFGRREVDEATKMVIVRALGASRSVTAFEPLRQIFETNRSNEIGETALLELSNINDISSAQYLLYVIGNEEVRSTLEERTVNTIADRLGNSQRGQRQYHPRFIDSMVSELAGNPSPIEDIIVQSLEMDSAKPFRGLSRRVVDERLARVDQALREVE